MNQMTAYIIAIIISIIVIIICIMSLRKSKTPRENLAYAITLAVSVVLLVGLTLISANTLYQQHQSDQTSAEIEKPNENQDTIRERQLQAYRKSVKDIREGTKERYGIDITDTDAEIILNAEDQELVRLSTNRIVMVRHLSSGDFALFEPTPSELPAQPIQKQE